MRIIVICAALYVLAVSGLLFVAMGADKRFARHEMRRVPEKKLLLFALLGGAPGGLLGMYAFRHKTRHWYFVLGYWALAVVQLGALAWAAYRFM